ncbi:MAG: hypothetical protein JWP35_4076 [Caulobacter sp.]|nr:hypothetical protein [Caulobacter sp.]
MSGESTVGGIARPRPLWLSIAWSIGAVVAAALVVVALSMGSDELSLALKLFPGAGAPDALFLEPLAYRSLYAVLGGWMAARLAPRAPMTHALVLGAIGTAVSLAGAIVTSGHEEFGPGWYSWALVVTTLPLTWVGARLAGRKMGT